MLSPEMLERGTDKLTGLSFDLGEIQNSQYGTATNLKGYFPFTLPIGKYQYPKIVYNQKQIEEIVNDLLPISREIMSNLLDEEIAANIRNAVLVLSLSCPGDLNKDVLEVVILYFWLGFVLDDVVDSDAAKENRMTYKSFVEIWKPVAAKEVNLFDTLPGIHPTVEAVKKLGIYTTNLAEKCIPNFIDKIYSNGFLYQTGRLMQANIAVPEFNREGLTYSETGVFEMYRASIGNLMAIEFTLLYNNVEIPEYIKTDILFQSAMNNCADILTGYNSILGLPRDCTKNQEDGPLMYLIVKKGYGMQDAFDKTMELLNDAYSDFKMNTKKLAEVYGDTNECIHQFIELMGYLIAGTLFGYKIGHRYNIQQFVKLAYSDD